MVDYNQRDCKLAAEHATVSRQLDYACEILDKLVKRARRRGHSLNTPTALLQCRLVNRLSARQRALIEKMICQ